MAGFLRRLLIFYRQLATGGFEGPDAPWHPPVAYSDASAGCMVIRADLPASDRTRHGACHHWAIGVQADEDRTDIVGWLTADADEESAKDAAYKLVWKLIVATAATGHTDAFLIPAIALPRPIAFEYPKTIGDLLGALETVDASYLDVPRQVTLGMRVNRLLTGVREAEASTPTFLLIRAPADKRFSVADGPAHFAVWRLTAEDETLISGEADPDQAQGRLLAWLRGGKLSWVHIYDARPADVIRRDTGRPVEKLRGRRILVLGCGALGAPIAEHCVRAGAAELILVDNGDVNPGILVRQPYYDADIGRPKAEVLARRLRGIRPEVPIFGIVADVLSLSKRLQRVVTDCDLIVDATADRSVAVRIERMRRDKPRHWPDLATVGISHTARYGMAAVTPRGAVGAGVDAYRRLALAALDDAALADAYREFFPSREERIEVEPERGCSAPTFIGSATDVSALAAQLLDCALAGIQRDLIRVSAAGDAVRERHDRRTLRVVRLGDDAGAALARTHLILPHDRVVGERNGRYEVRIDRRVMARLQHIVRATAAEFPCVPAVETGGLLLGQFDDACRVAWVSEATPPPEGTVASPHRLVIQAAAAREYARERSGKTGGLVSFIGLWHTHPDGPAWPSEVDLGAMEGLLAAAPGRSPRLLFLVLNPGGEARSPVTGGGSGDWDPAIYAEVFLRG